MTETGGPRAGQDRPTGPTEADSRNHSEHDALQEAVEPGDEPEDDAVDEDEAAPGGRLRRRLRRNRNRPPRKRLSEMLDEMAADENRPRISIGDLMAAMSGRAIGALLLIFAFPNVFPTPPGTSGLLGLPLVYLAAQMMLGRIPWLPPFIANRSMTREDFSATMTRATPILARAERLLKPRLTALVSRRGEQVLGVLVLVLALVVMLPIPLGNMLPAFAICLIALGVLEKDGLWAAIGALLGLVSLVIVSGVVWAMAKAALFVLANAF
jgi:hypothetical protein